MISTIANKEWQARIPERRERPCHYIFIHTIIHMADTASPQISIVSPVYMGAHTIAALSARINAELEAMQTSYEIILVNDASPDGSWSAIQELCAADSRIKGINLSRNFGQHQAIAAGLSRARGQWVVVMDCDLQDRPEDIPGLIRKAAEGYHIVQAERAQRYDPAIRKLSSAIYRRLMSACTGNGHATGNFGIYSRRVIEEYNRMPETDKQFAAQIEHLGFSRAVIPTTHDPRGGGRSSYTMGRLAWLAINSIVANTNKPLHWAVGIGLLMSALSFALALYNVIAKMAGIITLPGYTTTVFSIWFVGGMILMVLGITGLYIGRIFDQVKGRQPYIIMDEINF